MAWHRPGGKPLPEPMMAILMTHICVSRPEWVNCMVSGVYSYVVLWNQFTVSDSVFNFWDCLLGYFNFHSLTLHWDYNSRQLVCIPYHAELFLPVHVCCSQVKYVHFLFIKMTLEGLKNLRKNAIMWYIYHAMHRYMYHLVYDNGMNFIIYIPFTILYRASLFLPMSWLVIHN